MKGECATGIRGKAPYQPLRMCMILAHTALIDLRYGSYTFSLESKNMNLWQIYIGIHHPYEMYMRFCCGNHELLRRGFIRGLPLIDRRTHVQTRHSKLRDAHDKV